MKFTKVTRGWYATEDGKWAVIVDGYERVSQADRDGDGMLAGITGREWALARDPEGRLRESHNAGENVDWFPTMRAAKHYARGMAARLNM